MCEVYTAYTLHTRPKPAESLGLCISVYLCIIFFNYYYFFIFIYIKISKENVYAYYTLHTLLSEVIERSSSRR